MTTLQTNPQAPGAARLLIHADRRDGDADGVLHRLRAIVFPSARRGPRLPLCLRVEDLRGRAVVAIDGAGPLVDLPLPAGTYQVNAGIGKVSRSYTMTLLPGESFDLHLRLG